MRDRFVQDSMWNKHLCGTSPAEYCWIVVPGRVRTNQGRGFWPRMCGVSTHPRSRPVGTKCTSHLCSPPPCQSWNITVNLRPLEMMMASATTMSRQLCQMDCGPMHQNVDMSAATWPILHRDGYSLYKWSTGSGVRKGQTLQRGGPQAAIGFKGFCQRFTCVWPMRRNLKAPKPPTRPVFHVLLLTRDILCRYGGKDTSECPNNS